MKHIKTLLLVMLIIASSQICAQTLTKYDPKTEWTDIFKEYATFKCICEITKEDIVESMRKHKDYSFVVHHELLSIQREIADTAGRNFAKRIPFISNEKESDLYGYKPLLSYCLMFSKSPYLDSLASQRYNIFMKTNGKRWLNDNQK